MAAVPSAWAAFAAPPAKPAGQGDVLQGVVRGEVAERDAEMGNLTHSACSPARSATDSSQKLQSGATESRCWQILAMFKGEIFFK